jgi:hypothetical protein
MIFSLVHRTTSHGACGVSASSGACLNRRLLDIEDCRECGERKAGEEARGDASGEGESREEKRRSNGWSEVGRLGRRELCETGMLLPGEESLEPYADQHDSVKSAGQDTPGSKAYRRA